MNLDLDVDLDVDVYLRLNLDSHRLGDQNEDSGQRLQEEIPMENE